MAPSSDGTSTPVGSEVGPFTIERLLGRGGMGEVFLARDRRQSRQVALKLLPPHALISAVSRERLRREGALAATLQHPNICEIYQAGEADGRPFIAMEYVEGAPLDELLTERTFSVRDVVEIGCQLADALDHARAHGVVHRDLGARNILLTPAGRAKILDFGLAHSRDFADEAERTRRLTDPGLVLGTVEYMSPEQALGQSADHRSDLFSLGVVLFELLTGRLPFDGRTKMERIWMLANRDPHVIQATPGTPLAELAAIIRRLLQKDPRRRYQLAGDVRADLERMRARLARRRKVPLPVLLRPLAGIAAGMAFVFVGLAPTTFWLSVKAEESYRADLERRSAIWVGTLPDQGLHPRRTVPVNATSLWVGNNGDLVYATIGNSGVSSVWRLPVGADQPLTIASPASQPTVTPDGRTVVFTGTGSRPGLFRVNADGSDLFPLVGGDASDARITADGQWVVFVATLNGTGRTLHRVAITGGPVEHLGGQRIDSRPALSPDGRRVAFESRGRAMVCELSDCERPSSILLGAEPRIWTADGLGLVYVSRPGQSNLWVAPLAGGPPRQLTHFSEETITTLAISPDGRQVAVTRQRPLAEMTLASIFN